jgi:SpoVK/Ycf46/Vps4 family AAA+-type ATPase
MREPFDETVRRGIHPLVDAVALELAEDFDSNEKKAVPQADLEKKRIEYIFSETPGLKPAHIGDIRGMPHVVEDIRKFIAFLKGYQKFKERDVRVQPGIFLCGPPGTGKRGDSSKTRSVF